MFKVLLKSLKCFHEHHGTIRTAAMTYMSSLCLFPLVTLISSIAGQLDYVGLLQGWLMEWDRQYELDIPLDSLNPLLNELQQVNFASLGAIGSLSLFLTFWLLLQNLETNINAPWECKSPRPLRKRFGLFAPFMGILFGSTILLSIWLEGMKKLAELKMQLLNINMESPFWAGGAALGFLAIILFVFLIFCYSTLPRTRTIKVYSIWAALITSVTLCITIALLISLQGFLFTKYSAIYGSFAILPTLAIGLWICWLIVLIGNSINLEFHKKAGWNNDFAYPSKKKFILKAHKLIPPID